MSNYFPGRPYSWDAALERGRKGVPPRKITGAQTLGEALEQQKASQLARQFERERLSRLQKFEVRFSRSFLGMNESGTQIVEAFSASEAALKVKGAYSVRLALEQESIADWCERNKEFL